jgi:DNA-binding beta-propeller fold protein YncE
MYMGPESGETEVTVDTPVVVDFSEPVDRNTVSTQTFSLTSEDGVQVNGFFEFLINDSRVVFRPDESLEFGKDYIIDLKAGEFGIYDISEVRLPLEPGDPLRTATFTTANELTIPFLEYLNPVSGVDGAVVKIAGSGFDPVPENNLVVFNGSEAIVTDATLHTLTTKVPGGAISGSVPVIVNGIESSNSKYFSIFPQSPNPCAEPIENANTGSRSRSAAISPDAASAYVTNYWDHTVTAIKIWDDGHLEALSPEIQVGNNPFDIDINHEGTRAYVTNYSSHTVSVIELDKANPNLSYRSKDISVGVNPYGIAVAPDKKVYVANYESKNITVIDADPNSGGFDHAVANVNTGSRNRSIAISQDAALAVVTGDNGVNIIQFAESGNYADAIVTNANSGTRTRDAAIRPDAGLAVVTTEDGDVLVLDIYPGSEYFGTVIANANTGSRSRNVAIGQDALFVYISGTDPDVVEVWKLNLGGGIGGSDASSFPNIALEWHADIPLEDGIDPEDLVIDPYGQRLYIVNTSVDEKNGQLNVVRICCGPVAQERLVGDLFSIIQNLVGSGVLNEGQANALTVKLDQALLRLAQGKTKVAVNVLGALIDQILDLKDEGVLTEEQANGLIEKIHAIIAELEPATKSAHAFVEVEEYEVPGESTLGPIYPNPFKQATTIQYEVSTEDGAPVRVRLSVINSTGQVVAYLVDQMLTPGHYTVEWDARYHDDRMVADGIYYVRFTAGQVQLVEKAVVIR